MDPSTTPSTICSAKEQTPAPIPATPNASIHTQSPLPEHTPRTPGSAALNACTLDELLFAKVAVHTAKCTECDKRNMGTMRRCPGCTFQVCQPCYEKRQQECKGLVHGSMPTPGATEAATPNGSGVRTARRKPQEIISPTERLSTTLDNGEPEQPAEVATKKDYGSSAATLNTGKRAAKTSPSENSGLKESLECTSDSDRISPTPRKRPRTGISIAGSAFATAVEEPTIPHLRRQPSLAETHEALTSATSIAPNAQLPAREPSITRAVRGPSLAATHEVTASTSLHQARTQPAVECTPIEPFYNEVLYENTIKNYKEPLLARRQPVLSNPVAHIPAIIKRGGKPRPSAEQIYQNIQEKVREKLNKASDSAIFPAETPFQLAMHSKEGNAQALMFKEHMDEEQAFTVRKHTDNANMSRTQEHVKNKQENTVQNHVENQHVHTDHANTNSGQTSSAQEHVQNTHASPAVSAHAEVPTTYGYMTTAPSYTVRDCVQQEAVKYLDNTLLDEDDKKALFDSLQSGALIWGKQTYSNQALEAQRVLRSGLNLRLDAIDSVYTTELQVLIAEQAASMIQDLIKWI